MPMSTARYLQVIRTKTAKLFRGRRAAGAILGKATPEVETGLAAYGMHLGTAFQIIDDVLDYRAPKRNGQASW